MKLKLISMLLCMALLLTACGSKAASAEASASGTSAANAVSAENAASAADNTVQQSAAETAEAAQTDTGSAAAGQTEAAAGASPEVSEDPGIAFPYSLDDGRLAANSVFQSSVPNPDCNDEEGENIATLEIVNQSGMYLDSAVYTVTLTDGETFSFETDGIPDGGTVWAFELTNKAVELQPAVVDITCTAYYADSSPMMEDQVSVQMDGATATITNATDTELYNLKVGFHSIMDNVYFGGLTAQYNIDELPAGSSVTLDITEAWLGEAAAVYVRQDET